MSPACAAALCRRPKPPARCIVHCVRARLLLSKGGRRSSQRMAPGGRRRVDIAKDLHDLAEKIDNSDEKQEFLHQHFDYNESCRKRQKGEEVVWPHSRRLPSTSSSSTEPPRDHRGHPWTLQFNQKRQAVHQVCRTLASEMCQHHQSMLQRERSRPPTPRKNSATSLLTTILPLERASKNLCGFRGMPITGSHRRKVTRLGGNRPQQESWRGNS